MPPEDEREDAPVLLDEARFHAGQDHAWAYRQAAGLIPQLPEGHDDALLVLWYARQLLKAAPRPKPKPKRA